MKLFARWRVKVWDRRLAVYRRDWQQAVAKGPDHAAAVQAVDGVTPDVFYERLTTHALRRRTVWRKRAGVRK